MKVVSIAFALVVATCLLGCPGEEKKPEPGAATTAAATASAQNKPAAAPAAKPSGTSGW